MGVPLLDLVETALRVAKQALGKRAGKPDSGGLVREAHAVAHCIHKEEGHSYAELVDRLGLMPAICGRLGLHPDALPDPTAFYHSLDRYAMYIWRALLRVSAQARHRPTPTLPACRSCSRAPTTDAEWATQAEVSPTQDVVEDTGVRPRRPGPYDRAGPTDPDHRYHGAVGRVVAIRRSPLSAHTGDPRDDYLYRVAFDDDPDAEMLFRHDDLDSVSV